MALKLEVPFKALLQVYSGGPDGFLSGPCYEVGDKHHEAGDKVLRMSGKSSTFAPSFEKEAVFLGKRLDNVSKKVEKNERKKTWLNAS